MLTLKTEIGMEMGYDSRKEVGLEFSPAAYFIDEEPTCLRSLGKLSDRTAT